MNYSIKEIIDIAIGMEETGHDFYKDCEKKFKDQSVAEIFKYLAAEELVHKKYFESIKSDLKEEPGNFTEDYFNYLKSIGGGRVFSAKEDRIKSINTPEEAIVRALQDEKDSILLYTEVKRLYKEGTETAGILDKIIEEERSHTIKLADLLDKIQKSL